MGNTAFYIACLGGRTDMAWSLLHANSEINKTNNAGMAAIHAACINGNT